MPDRKESAGLLCYRRDAVGAIEVLLAHPGGPFFRNKDAGAWSIPKGLANEGEELLAAARREFTEEVGWTTDAGDAFMALESVRMKSGKTVHAWAFASRQPGRPELPGTSVVTLQWPPKSGRELTFPEIDRAEFFSLPAAREKIIPVQQPFLTRLQAALEQKPDLTNLIG